MTGTINSRQAQALSLLLLIGPTAAAAQGADPATMTNKILAGYQGWFGCPNDGSGIGWEHWSKSRTDLGPGLYNVDLWPDISEFDSEELFPAPNVMLLDGTTGQVFSSRIYKTTERHCKWMKDAGIDGVLLQRFLAEPGGPFFAYRNVVTQNIAAASATHGRVFAIEYDISGGDPENLYAQITQDWQHLIITYNLTNHPRYQRHEGKPVVAIWGLGFNDRPGTPEMAAQIINFFKTAPDLGGNYVIGGVPEGWRTRTGSSKTDPAWSAVYRSFDAISPWSVGRYNNTSGVNSFRTNFIVPDLAECNSLGIEYLPVFWPGFSWANLQNQPPGTPGISRNGGQFFWDQANAFQSAGLSMMKIAMFDELDEGTAIMKVSENHPTTDNWVDYGTLPHDWYMRLAGAATQMLRKEIPISSTIPIDSRCGGDEVSINLGEDTADRMTHPQNSDGDTTVVTQGGVLCRRNVNSLTDLYFYFAVDDSFAFQGNRREICITIDYYNTGGSTGSLRLEYDSDGGGTFKNGGSVTLGSTSTWRRKIYYVNDAYFGNRQNAGADFRIALVKTGGGSFYLDRVLVGSPIPKPAQITLSESEFNHVIRRGAAVPAAAFTLLNTGVASLNYTISENAGWLTIAPASGKSTGETDTIDVIYDTATLAPGTYSTTISVADANAGNSPRNIPVTVDVRTYGDLDLDGDVDQEDFGRFQRCLTGPVAPVQPGCEESDYDGNGHIDTADFNQFLPCMNGPGNPPGC